MGHSASSRKPRGLKVPRVPRQQGPQCQTCLHPERDRIERGFFEGLAALGLSRMYGVDHEAITRHCTNHVAAELRRALAEAGRVDARSKLLDEYYGFARQLQSEAAQYVEDAKNAVTFVKCSPKKWAKMRDVAQMGPALQAARGIHELVGRSVKILGEQQLGPSVPFVLILPQLPGATPKAIDVTPGAPQLEAGDDEKRSDGAITIDVKAMT